MSEASGAERHRYYEELAVTHVMGGVSESDGAVLRAHLLECAECRARVGELRRIAHDLADVERDERRVRAAKAVETKRRESEDDDTELDEPQPNPRTSRIVFLLGLLFVVGLAGWNFMLRSSLEIQAANIAQAEAATQLFLDGRAAEVDLPGNDLTPRSQVRYDADRFVVVLDGADPAVRYHFWLLDDEGVVDDFAPVPLAEGESRMVRTSERPRGAGQLIVTRIADGVRPSGQGVEGQRVLAAELG